MIVRVLSRVGLQVALTKRRVGRWRRAAVDDARSDLVLQEAALFLYQLQYDSRMQQALLFDAFDVAQKLKSQRDEVDALMEKFQTAKGRQSGVAPLSAEFMDRTATGLNLRSALNEAVEAERYEEAAKIRDQIQKLNEDIDADVSPLGPSPDAVRFPLGHIVRHKLLNYRDWQDRVDISGLPDGTDQPFYHVLVDERDWPAYTKGPPVGYVPQEMLETVAESEFGDDMEAFQKIQHPFLINMFLGTDNQGSYVPCTPLRNKYKIERKDSYPPEDDDNDN